MLSVPLALICLASPMQAPDIGPVLGEDVAAVIQVDLARLDPPNTLRRIVGKAMDEVEVAGASRLIGLMVDPLKRAGAREVYALVDLADMSGLPIVAVPLPAGADGAAIAATLKAGLPDGGARWPAAETIRGVVVAGSEAALARIKAAKPSPRPELAAALAAAGDGPIRLAIIPGETLRRSVEESVPSLPAQLGGGPISTLTRGMNWAVFSLSVDPKPVLRAVVSAKDDAAAVALRKVAVEGLKMAAAATRQDPAVAALSDALGRMIPEAKGDRVTLDADLSATAALVALPIGQVREAARRSQCTNNMKQFGLVMHNYLSAHQYTFPPAYSVDKAGKPLLSWRVHVLPYLDQQELYAQFRLDEPWDSDHNKPLISRMPAFYACPDAARGLAAEGKTTYLTPRGPGTLFPGAEGVKISAVTDGTSNTVMVVDAADASAVTWTKPDDWEAGPGMDPKTLLGHHPSGTNVGFADGSVRFLKGDLEPAVLRSLLTRNGGEVIIADDY